MERTKENKAMVLFIKYVFRIHLLPYIYIIIIFPVILVYIGIFYESLDETCRLALLIISIIVSSFCVYFIAMEKKTFSEFKRLVDSVYATEQFYEKREEMQEEISDLKNSNTTVGNFIELIRDIDVEIAKLSQNDNVNDIEFKSSLENILRAMYDRSNIFCIEDSHASKFEVMVYWWSESNKLIPSRHANKNMNHTHTYREWETF